MPSPRADGASSPTGPRTNGFAPEANGSSPSTGSTLPSGVNNGGSPSGSLMNGRSVHFDGASLVNGDSSHSHSADPQAGSYSGATTNGSEHSITLRHDLENLVSQFTRFVRSDHSVLGEDEREGLLTQQFMIFQNRLHALLSFQGDRDLAAHLRNQLDDVATLAQDMDCIFERLIHLEGARRTQTMNNLAGILAEHDSPFDTNVESDGESHMEQEVDAFTAELVPASPEEDHHGESNGSSPHQNGDLPHMNGDSVYLNGSSYLNGADRQLGAYHGTTNGSQHSAPLLPDLLSITTHFLRYLASDYSRFAEDEREILLTMRFVSLQNRLRTLVGFSATGGIPSRLRSQPENVVDHAQQLDGFLEQLVLLEGAQRMQQISEYREIMDRSNISSMIHWQTDVQSAVEQDVEEHSQLDEFAAWLSPQLSEEEPVGTTVPEESENEEAEGSEPEGPRAFADTRLL